MPDNRWIADRLRLIEDASADFRGAKYLQALVLLLTRSLGVRFAMVTEAADASAEHGRAVAVADREREGAPFFYDTADLPCRTVLGGTAVKIPCNAVELYPGVGEMTAYCGRPLRDANGTVTGLLAVEDSQAIERIDEIDDLLRLLAGRVAAELECLRQMAERPAAAGTEAADTN